MQRHFTPTAPLAYSYVRFSSPKQAEGDSLRRQATDAADWCARNNVRLDASLTLHDLGHSAFRGAHRENPDRHALAAFLKLVEEGRIPRGSYLIVESLDRLSREHVTPALTLLLNLTQAGVRVVQLKPVEVTFGERPDPMQLMMAIMELSRGHSESEMKSVRHKANWREMRRKARAGVPMTKRLPAWVRLGEDGKLALVPERAAVVRQIFALAAAGYGVPSIVAKLNADKVPPIGGRAKLWCRAYVALIIRDKRAAGELQPCTGHGSNRIPDGPPIVDYYPAAVTEQQWNAARAAVERRKKSPGRLGKSGVNVFAGLLRNARDGDTYIMSQRTSRSRGRVLRKFAVLQNRRAEEGAARMWSFPYDVFERAILAELRELNPADVLGDDGGAAELKVLEDELQALDGELAALAASLERRFNEHLLAVSERKGARRDEVATKLAQARTRAATPVTATWAELPGLIDGLGKGEARDARLRLRGALRRLVDSMWIVVAGAGRYRLCEVRVYFQGARDGQYRAYTIIHRPAAHQPEKWIQLQSYLHPEDAQLGLSFGTEDLRDPTMADMVAVALESYPTRLIDELMAREEVAQ